MDLLDGSDEDVKFTINEDYASKYSKWREKEVLQKLKDRAKNLGESDDETSSSEDEDESNNLSRLDKSFFTALSYLKKKDPRIYDENTRFFPNPDTQEKKFENQTEIKTKKDKPFVLRDYERQIILERGGKLDESDEETSEMQHGSSSPTYVEEQKALKESFKKFLENSDSEGEEGSFLKRKEKTEAELQKEEEDYVEWLKGQRNELKDKNTESELKGLYDFWNDPNLNPDEAYLKDYILNRRFLEPEHDNDQLEFNKILLDNCELEEDSKCLEQMEQFEHKYNFRFEEPDPEFIKRYPRSVESSARRKDDRRKRKRQEIKERKETEMRAKREEIKQLKALKRKEILEKINKIKEITGNNDIALDDEDFEGDFNPEKHDKKMKEMFNDDYYGVEESEKPECPELEEELEIENWNNWEGKDEKEENYEDEGEGLTPACEDPNFIMDCDYDPKAELQEELKRMSKSKKKQRRKSKFALAIAKQKPVFDPNDKRFEEYFDEYYQLDCEDIIGDLPCRFKYRKTTPNNYGLTIDEILRADEKELNRWCSLKKVVKYKPDNVEKYDVHAYKQKAQNEALKRKILPSLFKDIPDAYSQENGSETGEVKKKKKKKKKPELHMDSMCELDAETHEENTGQGKLSKKKRKWGEQEHATQSKIAKLERTVHISNSWHSGQYKHHIEGWKSSKCRKKSGKDLSDSNFPISDDRLKAYGIHPKKFKNKLIYGKQQSSWNNQ